MNQTPLKKNEQTPFRQVRKGLRASFLFPSWLSTPSKKSLSFSEKVLRAIIKLAQGANTLFRPKTPHSVALSSYLKSLVLELDLRELGRGDQVWQKNFIHRYRQQQLICFEEVLKCFDRTTKKERDSKHLHAFPEIMLVMAKTIAETMVKDSELEVSASRLVASYQHLRDFLYERASKWSFNHVNLSEEDPALRHLLDFRTSWESFCKTRKQQIKQQELHEIPHAEDLSKSIGSS